LREARALAATPHPNICPLLDLGEVDGIPFFTMSRVQGEPLTRLIQQQAPVDPLRAVTLVRKVALAMAYAHQKGGIHRDLKPGNILIQEHDEPVVVDFGLAYRSLSPDATRLTLRGTVMGTPAYMAPEQVNGDIDQVGPATDVYALGVILYELLTGQLPFSGQS